MKKPRRTKLSLSTESIRVLAADRLADAHGGATVECPLSVGAHCNTRLFSNCTPCFDTWDCSLNIC